MALKTQNNLLKIIIWLIVLALLLSIGYFLLIKEKTPSVPEHVIVFSEQEILNDLSFDEIEDELSEIKTSNPFNIPEENAPKIAIIVNNMGLNENLTEVISKSVDENVSLAFSPYSRNLKDLINSTHELNKETYVNLIIKSNDFSKEDTGPKALSLESENDTNILIDIFNTAEEFNGVLVDGYINPEKEDGMKKILKFISENNILFIDASDNDVINNITVDGLQKLRADIIINEDTDKSNFRTLLNTAENIAKEKGHAIIVINPKPISIIMLVEWIEYLSHLESNPNNIIFVPVSTLMGK